MENPFDFSKEKAANTVKRIWLVNKDQRGKHMDIEKCKTFLTDDVVHYADKERTQAEIIKYLIKNIVGKVS